MQVVKLMPILAQHKCVCVCPPLHVHTCAVNNVHCTYTRRPRGVLKNTKHKNLQEKYIE